ncbi:MAG: hypothetical protein KDM81_19110, partial [Verrucomicrobiae bacterium]|nr:hypothetical protein [Verrucomicrobiae bacterium]
QNCSNKPDNGSDTCTMVSVPMLTTAGITFATASTTASWRGSSADRPTGSSAMPHKRNPITWERLTGLARVLRGNALVALENVALWHERDISHSSTERIIFPDSCCLLDYMFGLLTRLMEGLQVYPDNMQKNLGLSLGMWNSQTVLLALIRKGLTREQAYDLVQRNAMETWAVKHAGRDDADFLEQLKRDPAIAKHLTPAELDQLCSLDFHFKEVSNRFKKLGL